MFLRSYSFIHARALACRLSPPARRATDIITLDFRFGNLNVRSRTHDVLPSVPAPNGSPKARSVLEAEQMIWLLYSIDASDSDRSCEGPHLLCRQFAPILASAPHFKRNDGRQFWNNIPSSCKRRYRVVAEELHLSECGRAASVLPGAGCAVSAPRACQA
jgi:hypothetical protein